MSRRSRFLALAGCLAIGVVAAHAATGVASTVTLGVQPGATMTVNNGTPKSVASGSITLTPCTRTGYRGQFFAITDFHVTATDGTAWTGQATSCSTMFVSYFEWGNPDPTVCALGSDAAALSGGPASAGFLGGRARRAAGCSWSG